MVEGLSELQEAAPVIYLLDVEEEARAKKAESTLQHNTPPPQTQHISHNPQPNSGRDKKTRSQGRRSHKQEVIICGSQQASLHLSFLFARATHRIHCRTLDVQIYYRLETRRGSMGAHYKAHSESPKARHIRTGTPTPLCKVKLCLSSLSRSFFLTSSLSLSFSDSLFFFSVSLF